MRDNDVLMIIAGISIIGIVLICIGVHILVDTVITIWGNGI